MELTIQPMELEGYSENCNSNLNFLPNLMLIGRKRVWLDKMGCCIKYECIILNLEENIGIEIISRYLTLGKKIDENANEIFDKTDYQKIKKEKTHIRKCYNQT